MKRKCVLETSGYQLVFYLASLDNSPNHIGLLTEFVLNASHDQSCKARSRAKPVYISQLQKLIPYLENHVAALVEKPGHESHTFVTYDLSFQIQALSGEVRSQNEGEFTIECLVNVGKPEGNPCSTYVGGEAVVTLKNLQEFTSDFQTVLNEFSISLKK